MKNTSGKIILIASVFALSACGKSLNLATQNVVESIENGASCSDFSEKLSGVLTAALIDQKDLPSVEELESALREKSTQGPEREKMIQDSLHIYRLLIEETRNQLGVVSKDELLEALTALEIGDHSTPERAALQAKLGEGFQKVQESAKSAGMNCVPSAPEQNPQAASEDFEANASLSDKPASKMALPVKGALRVLSTAYQSCDTLELPAMSASTPGVDPKAIKITGTHSSGVGLKREIASLSKLNASHYYIREGIESATCFNVPKNPLIYDYGGKPYAGSTETAALNLFKNAGSGTGVLGIDCSGYVFSALAVSGLRVAPGKKLKASLVYGISARMYMNPSSNGLSCLAAVPSKINDSLRNGDILATTGHIVMIDAVGSDPFGVQRIQRLADCRKENLSHRNFDFDVLHSAPTKGGVGINRSRSADYLNESSSMRAGLVDYAVAACKAQFGQASTALPTLARLVRHKLTAECMDKQVPLEGESCVQSCVSRL